MNKLSHHTIILLAALAALFFVSACKKKNTSTSPAPTGQLYIHIRSAIDTTIVRRGDTATDATGRRIKLNVAEFYMCDVTLYRANGSYVRLGSRYILKDLDDETYFVDSVETGSYVSVAFSIGINATANTTNPASYPAAHPLSLQSPNMWFGTPTQGYIFMHLQGLADTTATHTGMLNYPFRYQTGTSNMLRSVTMPQKLLTVSVNQVTNIRLIADYGKALDGVNIKDAPASTPWLNETIATRISNNIPTMFRYDE